MIDGSLFQDEIKARQVMAVPPCFERHRIQPGPHEPRRNFGQD
jgi:alkyl hydroperoxide reductase subunit AhpF